MRPITPACNAGFWQAMIELAQRRAAEGYSSPYNIAMFYACLGDREQAFEYLERASRERSSALAALKVDPMLDSLRPDPRLAGLLRRVGLEP